VAYFNSFYSEAATVIFLVATVAFALVATPGGDPDAVRRRQVAAYFAAATLFATAKLQNVLLAVPLAILRWPLSISLERGPRSRPRRLAIAGVTVLLLGATVTLAAYALFSRQLRMINRYNTVFYEILGHSPDPAADAAALGLDPSYARYAGTHAFTLTI